METTRRDLEDAGFYDALPGDLRPQPAFISQNDARAKLKEVTTNLFGYMGPDNGTATSILNEQRIEDWVLQFSTDVAPIALTAAAGVKMLSRSDANEALRTFCSGASRVRRGTRRPAGRAERRPGHPHIPSRRLR